MWFWMFTFRNRWRETKSTRTINTMYAVARTLHSLQSVLRLRARIRAPLNSEIACPIKHRMKRESSIHTISCAPTESSIRFKMCYIYAFIHARGVCLCVCWGSATNVNTRQIGTTWQLANGSKMYNSYTYRLQRVHMHIHQESALRWTMLFFFARAVCRFFSGSLLKTVAARLLSRHCVLFY